MAKLDLNQIQYLDRLLEREAAEGRIPGSNVLVGDMDGILYQNAYGAVSSDTIFCLCSMTKPVTAVAALRLIDQGVISPNEPVAKYLPSFRDVKVLYGEEQVPAQKEMRIRDLLNMTSGLLYPMDQLYGCPPAAWELLGEEIKTLRERIDAGENISYSQACEVLARAPLAFEPGTKWAYGMSADVLGGVIEAASGMAFRDYVKKEILEPLGMEDTDYLVPEEKLARVADVMSQEPGNPQIMDGKKGFPDDGRALFAMPYVTSPGGGWLPFFGRGLYATLQDYGKFASMLLHGGTVDGRMYFSAQTAKMLQKNHLSKEQSVSLWADMLDGYGYGNLMRVMLRPEDAQYNGNVGEFGWDGLLGTYFFVDPQAGIYFVYMQQGPVDFTVRHKMRRIVYSSLV